MHPDTDRRPKPHHYILFFAVVLISAILLGGGAAPHLTQGANTTIFYPTAGDGRVQYLALSGSGCNSTQFNTVQGAASGNSVDFTSATRPGLISSGCTGGLAVRITRGFLAFDTSPLPDNAIITAATINVFVPSKANDVDDGNDFAVVVQGRQASTNSLSNSDYNKAGNQVTAATELSDRLDLTALALNQYNTWSLNGTGLGFVSLTGVSKFALREGHDLLKAWPSYAPDQFNGFAAAMSEQTGTTQDPYLEVTYTLPSPDITPPTVNITSPTDGATVSGVITVDASASDNVAVAGVQFYVDAAELGLEDTTSPYEVSFNTFTVLNGSHLLTAVARDTSNNTTTSTAVNVTVTNQPQANLPNVVLIVSDDQRWDTVSYSYMPVLNSVLGPESVKFGNAFDTTPLCCPSRSSILTGQYTHNHGVWENSGPIGGADKFNDSSTIATWLKQAGYRTGLYGKYMNGYNLLAPSTPLGWDEWHTFLDAGYYNYQLVENGVTNSYGGASSDYSTTVLENKAVSFINSTPQNQSLFLYYAPFTPHSPATPALQDIGSFTGISPWRPLSFNEANVSDKPAWVRNRAKLTSTEIAKSDALRQSQLESLQSFDRSIGNIVNALQSAGRLNNTMIIFISDNGLLWGEHRFYNIKRCPYEECIRAILWVRLPGQVGRTENALALNIDIAPTIAAYTGITPPPLINGVSLLNIINDPNALWRSDFLVEYKHTSQVIPDFNAVRDNQGHIYIEYATGEKEFYNLNLDPYQLTNSINDTTYTSIISALKARLPALKAE
ncbi:hypothetical protein EPN83_02815 [Patescibacteria group bacterium]|nr:MAG: hypothetical protein EPN83_02815 [Patescibacteria group bacterium]